MKYKNRAIAAAIIVATAPRMLLAADAPAPALPGLSDLLNAWGLTTSGELAASYYHSNGYPGATWRGFDANHDSFQLDEGGLQIGYQPKTGVGGFVDVIAGTDAQILNEAESLKSNGAPYSYYSSSASAIDVRQAYLQYATGPLTIMAGKFLTLAGAEVINPALNTNFSRSLLFWELEPLTHTGVRATWAVTGTLNLTFGVNNGWNYTDLASSGSKTGEFNATWTPNKTVSASLTGYFGKDDIVYGGQDLSLVDFVGTYNVTSALTLVLNADFKQVSGNGVTGTGPTQHINGYALYANYAINDNWRVSLRGEYLDDLNGALISNNGLLTPGHTTEFTGTVGYTPAKNLELRAELRYDHAQQGDNTFVRSLNPALNANSNFEFALQGVYKFSLPPST